MSQPGTMQAGSRHSRETLTISARVTDEVAVQSVGLVARWPGAGQSVPWCPEFATRAAGTAQDGTWTVHCTVSTVVNSGAYDVWPYASDTLGNWVNINGGPTIATTAGFSVSGGISDTSPPQVLSLSASPASVSPGEKVTITARVTDDVGVQSVGLVARWPGAGQAVPWCPEFATRTSGTAQDGIWTVTCTVPDAVNSGTYQVWPYASDTLGNWVNINGGPSTDVNTTFSVTGGISDTSPPEILSLTVSPPTVSPGRQLTISARATDTAGVQSVGLVARWPGAGQAVPWCPEFATRTSGTAQDGIWTVTCTVPDVVNAGTYEVWPYASDTLGNWVNINGGPSVDMKATFTVG